MKAAKTWCIASVVVLAALSSASCGKDEANGNSGGTGTVLTGGSSGAGGTQGRGGQVNGGSSGSGTSAATKLGRGCLEDADCEDAKAPGLICISGTDTLLGDGAPPKGLCTSECTSDDECLALGPGSLCFPFEEGAESGYCVEGCSFGEPIIGAPLKCHDRPEFACTYVGAVSDTGDTCTDTVDDCQPGELCIEDTCQVVIPACMPSCRGDIDCEDGMFCDMGFLTGVCREEKVPGKPLGAPCTVPAEGEPAEPDECVGFCQADDATNTTGHCAATCALGRECGWNPATEVFDGACLYGTIITRESLGFTGDFGFCAPTCNCAGECGDETLGCFSLGEGQELPAGFRGPGVCFSPDPENPDEPQLEECVGTGGTGAGGSAAGGAGGEGATSQSGAPGEGGAGGAP